MARAAKTVKKPVYNEKSYRLTDSRSCEAFLLQVGRSKNLLFFDESKGYNRAIRHCPNEKSIFMDEQSEHALVEPIIFYRGILDVKKEGQTTQKFLDAHPANKANNGRWFEEINEEIEATEDIEMEELIIDIKQAIKEKALEKDGVFALEMVASVLKNFAIEIGKYQTSELKRMIYNYVDIDPFLFLNDANAVNIFDDEYIQRKYLVLRSIAEGVIKKSPSRKAMLWANGGKLIATAPQGIDLIEFFTDYLSSDEGILVIEEIKKRS
jgi:hypothetical protein